jgi:hypothetical protein
MKGPGRIAGVLLCLASIPWSSANADVVTQWNAITLGCVQGPPNPPNRGGPPGLLDIALVQAAVHDAVQAIEGRFEPYQYENANLRGVGSPAAAAAAAAYGVLVGLYQADDPCLAGVVNPAITYAGDPALQAGEEAAAAILPLYRSFFVLPTDPFLGGTAPGEWRPTPGVTQGANTWMAKTAPFVLNRPSQFRPEPAPPLTSEAYRRAYDEVKALGSLTGSTRTDAQTDLARFWSGNPIAMWFATVRAIADAHLPEAGDKARLLALVAFATADSQIAVYDTKYHYNFWRPITAIREGDADGNPRTVGDGAWTPFLVTPPYPDHSSGANNLSGAVTTMLRLYFGTDQMQFAITSGVGGVTVNPRTYTSFSAAADDVVDVRILQGIHFRFADVDGRQQGSRIAHWAYQKFLTPVPGVK